MAGQELRLRLRAVIEMQPTLYWNECREVCKAMGNQVLSACERGPGFLQHQTAR